MIPSHTSICFFDNQQWVKERNIHFPKNVFQTGSAGIFLLRTPRNLPKTDFLQRQRLVAECGQYGLCCIFKKCQIKFQSSNTPRVPKLLSEGCFAAKSARCLGSESVRYELSLSELQLPAKASKRQSNPCSSHNRGFCLAVSASESMPDNLRPLLADL